MPYTCIKIGPGSWRELELSCVYTPLLYSLVKLELELESPATVTVPYGCKAGSEYQSIPPPNAPTYFKRLLFAY